MLPYTQSISIENLRPWQTYYGHNSLLWKYHLCHLVCSDYNLYRCGYCFYALLDRFNWCFFTWSLSTAKGFATSFRNTRWNCGRVLLSFLSSSSSWLINSNLIDVRVPVANLNMHTHSYVHLYKPIDSVQQRATHRTKPMHKIQYNMYTSCTNMLYCTVFAAHIRQ